MKSSLGSKVLIVFMCIVLLPTTAYASKSGTLENEIGITKELLKQMEAELKKVEPHKREEYLAKFRDEHTLYRYVEPASGYTLFSSSSYGDTKTVPSYSGTGILVTNSRQGLWYNIISLGVSTILGVWRPVAGILSSVVALVATVEPDTSKAAQAQTMHSYTYLHLDSQVYMPSLFGDYWGTLATSTSRKTFHHESGWYMDEFSEAYHRTTVSQQLIREEYADHYYDHAGLEALAYNVYDSCQSHYNPDLCMTLNTYTESWN